MSNTRVVWAIVAAGVLAGGMVTGCSKSETPSATETKAVVEDISVAVGTGEFTDTAGDNDPLHQHDRGFQGDRPHQ